MKKSMASSSEKSVKPTEKQSFSQTCSLLSQYLKEGGNFGDLSLGISCNIEANEIPQRPAATTMNLFPMSDNSGRDVSCRIMTACRNPDSMNLFPHEAGFASKNETPILKDSSLNKPAPKSAPLTILYQSRVVVFNDITPDKAHQIMQLAQKESSQQSHCAATYPPQMPLPVHSHNNSFASNLPRSPIVSTPPVTPRHPNTSTDPSCTVPCRSDGVSNFSNSLIPEHMQPPSRPCDLPIARRNSLHRFLEKRKDRIISRAPYQKNISAGAPSKPADGTSWLGLAAQTSQ